MTHAVIARCATRRLLALLALVSLLASAEVRGAVWLGLGSPLHPARYESPDGRWVLETNPSARDGSGPGHLRLSHDGVLAWERDLPVSFRVAAVDDAGRVAGAGCTGGELPEGELIFVVLDAAGQLVGEQRAPREWSRFLHAPPNPDPRGVLLQPEAGVALLRVADPDLNRRRESWWRLSLAEGRVLPPWTDPQADLPADRRGGWSLAAVAVPGTPLVLAQWDLYEQAQGRRLHLVLHGQDGAAVWRHDLGGGHYGSDRDRNDVVDRRLRAGDGIAVSEAGGFQAWQPVDDTRLGFRVERSDDGWRVTSLGVVGRGLFGRAPTQPAQPRATAIEPRRLGTVEFGAASAVGDELDVRAWAVGDDGPLGVVRGAAVEGGPLRFERLDEQGLAQVSVPFPEAVPGEGGSVTLVCLGGPHWLAGVSTFGSPGQTWLVRLDADAGTAQVLPARDLPAPERLLPRPDGGFVMLGTFRSQYSSRDVLRACDPSGRMLWEVTENSSDPQALFGAKDVARRADGTLAVLENVRDQLKLFDASGRHLRSVNLLPFLGPEQAYLTTVLALPDGGVMVYDFSSGQWLRLDAELEFVGLLRLRDAEGTASEAVRLEHIGSDGRWWGRDPQTFVRLDETTGRVTSSVGPAPDTQALGPVARFGQCLDARGRPVLLDARTAVLHAFEADGRKRWTCALPRELFPDVRAVDVLAAYGDDHVIVIHDLLEGPWAEVDGDGRVVASGAEPFHESRRETDPSGARRELLFGLAAIPGRTDVWARVSDAFERRDGEGRRLARCERLPDGRWLSPYSRPAAAPDGSLAVVDSAQIGGVMTQRLVLIGADGVARRAVSLPQGIDSLGWPAYDGERVVSQLDDQLLIYDVATDTWSFAPLEDMDGTLCLLPPGGKEAWLFDWQLPRMTRWALP